MRICGLLLTVAAGDAICSNCTPRNKVGFSAAQLNFLSSDVAERYYRAGLLKIV